jgi:antitoxin VapB
MTCGPCAKGMYFDTYFWGVPCAILQKVFINGRSQAVRLPAAYRFKVAEVYVRQDPATGDVILSRRPANWAGFDAVANKLNVPMDFLGAGERAQVVLPEPAVAPRDRLHSLYV